MVSFWHKSKSRLPLGWRRWKLELLVGLFGLAAMNSIFLARAFRETHTIDRQSAGQLGDFVGGYFGTLFSLAAVVLVIRTLKNQVEASKEEHFETKYFELLKMHRDNVSEMQLGKAAGRKVFVLMLGEFRGALEVVRRAADRKNQKLDHWKLLEAAYCCVFFGAGPNSSRMLRMQLFGFDTSFVEALDLELNDPGARYEVMADWNLNYAPFEGHQSRLGHYYRHLYQMVKYVDQQHIEINKYEYVKTIRAQLSTHEQALLLLNSFTNMGSPWWDEGLIARYGLVRNIPLDFFNRDTELDIGELFEAGYFEWEESAKLKQMHRFGKGETETQAP